MIASCREHHNGFQQYAPIDLNLELDLELEYSYYFLNKKDRKQSECFRIYVEVENGVQKQFLSNSYYIGIDWIVPNKKALYVAPKVNKQNQQADYLGMLFSALKHPSISSHTSDLLDIKFDEPHIEIEQHQDLLTPLLVVKYLAVLTKLVRKGLKKSYYKVERNLYSKVKGKILVAETLKKNHFKNRMLHTACTYEEFGVNNLENRLLKKALLFVQRYLPELKVPHAEIYTSQQLSFVLPAFIEVSDEVTLQEVKQIKINAFYKEYKEAIDLAKLILKRFGYNINSIQNCNKTKTPPFWIDMSKLFELYVLGLLKELYGKDILYDKEAKGNYGLPDYLLTKTGEQMIIDAKYKLQYNDLKEDEEFVVSSKYAIENIRQISGYARDRAILGKLSLTDDDVVECLIVYPLRTLGLQSQIDLRMKEEISHFSKFYKLGVALPLIKSSDSK